MDTLLILVLILPLLNVAVFFVLCIPLTRIIFGYLFGFWTTDLRFIFLSFFSKSISGQSLLQNISSNFILHLKGLILVPQGSTTEVKFFSPSLHVISCQRVSVFFILVLPRSRHTLLPSRSCRSPNNRKMALISLLVWQILDHNTSLAGHNKIYL